MTILWDLLSPYLLQIGGAVALLLAWWGKGKLGERKGRKEAVAKRAAQDAKAKDETVERVLDETTSADPADAIRRRMRERAGKP
jgi:hypothetical protein